MANGQPDLVSPEDVRHVEFTEARRGYDRDEVHVFLDRVIVTLEELGRRLRSARQASGTVSPAPVSSGADVALHDPDGAAQRLLAAAQRTADQLIHEAGAQATAFSAEADQYATRVRRDADDYSAGVTGQADEHAALIRATAADEARRAAEELRAGLVDEIHDLEDVREALANDRALLESHLAAQRQKLQQVLASLQVAVEDGVTGLEMDEPPAMSGASLADVNFIETAPYADEPAFGSYDADATVQARSVFEGDDAPGFLSADAPTAPVEVYTDDLLEGLDDDVPYDDDDEEIDEDGDGDEDDTSGVGGSFGASLSRDFGDDDLAPAPRGGFFDDGLDDELDAPETPIFGQSADADDDDEDDFEPTAHERSIFDIDAERFDEPTLAVPVLDLDLDDEEGDDALRAAPMTRGAGEGDSGFFDELRAPASDDLFGAVDDDTDAALAAFFDQDEDEEDERWRRRFGR